MEYKDLVKDFADRTRHNLRVIENLERNGVEVFEVTQLVNSSLGLFIFPREEFVRSIPTTSLDELREQGWPPIETLSGRLPEDNLRELVRYLRNGIAHFNIEFKSENLNLTGFKIWNENPKGVKKWEALLTIDHFRRILDLFLKLLLDGDIRQGRDVSC